LTHVEKERRWIKLINFNHVVEASLGHFRILEGQLGANWKARLLQLGDFAVLVLRLV
jgi:hypothetical protein